MPIDTLLIANRGEIAVRIIRAAKEMGIRTVQVHSDADTGSLAARQADVAVNIGPPQAARSYLDTEAILDAARRHGADAIHPGYGFFSENAGFADAVEAAGIVFVGPPGDVIRLMGDKARAREVARKAGVPTVPGSEGRLDDLGEARKVAEEVGFPLLVKAAAGGGGRGIRLVGDIAEFDRHAPEASTEARAAFGDGGLYIERFVRRARHVEVQLLGDGKDCVHLHERECSLQRRRQKVWEEAPSTIRDPAVRGDLCAAAVRLGKEVGYRGAGTVEFLYDDDAGEFHFIEMNTRIQVEHPVTECVTGIDIVREMIAIAAGEPLGFGQDDVSCRGHAIEVRVNAEDPEHGFMPSPGVVTGVTLPGGMGVRFDGMVYPGCDVPPFYDSLIGKLIAWDSDRPRALDRMRRALGELEISGVKTTAPLFMSLVQDPDVRQGKFHTGWLEDWLEGWRPAA